MIDLALLKHWMMSSVTMQRDELREMAGSSKAFLYCSLSVDRCALFSCCCPAQFLPLALLPWVCSPSCLWLCLERQVSPCLSGHLPAFNSILGLAFAHFFQENIVSLHRQGEIKLEWSREGGLKLNCVQCWRSLILLCVLVEACQYYLWLLSYPWKCCLCRTCSCLRE